MENNFFTARDCFAVVYYHLTDITMCLYDQDEDVIRDCELRHEVFTMNDDDVCRNRAVEILHGLERYFGIPEDKYGFEFPYSFFAQDTGYNSFFIVGNRGSRIMVTNNGLAGKKTFVTFHGFDLRSFAREPRFLIKNVFYENYCVYDEIFAEKYKEIRQPGEKKRKDLACDMAEALREFLVRATPEQVPDIFRILCSPTIIMTKKGIGMYDPYDAIIDGNEDTILPDHIEAGPVEISEKKSRLEIERKAYFEILNSPIPGLKVYINASFEYGSPAFTSWVEIPAVKFPDSFLAVRFRIGVL